MATSFSTYLQYMYLQIIYMKTSHTKKEQKKTFLIASSLHLAAEQPKEQYVGNLLPPRVLGTFSNKILYSAGHRKICWKSPNPQLFPKIFLWFSFVFKNQNGACPLFSLNNLFLDFIFFYQGYLTAYIPLSRFLISLFLLFPELRSQLKILTKTRYKKTYS